MPDNKYTDLMVDNVIFFATGIKVQWSSQKFGFGEVSLYRDEGALRIDAEHMSEEFVKALFVKLVHITYPN